MRKVFGFILLLLLLALGGFIYWKYYFVFGEGVKAGTLNYLVKKGNVFKTYEGKMIQSGVRASGPGMQSYEFEFSVTDKRIADTLMANGGRFFELHYKEYHGSLPWRGFTPYIVDSIIFKGDANQPTRTF